jgi:hypothetical protein
VRIDMFVREQRASPEVVDLCCWHGPCIAATMSSSSTQGGSTPHTGPASDGRLLAERPLGEVIEAVAAAGVSPGAGAAGAIALALASACAVKAVAITGRHRSGDEALLPLREQLLEISRGALGGADEDARRFEEFTHSKAAASAASLIRAGVALEQLASRLMQILPDVEARVDPVVRGDVAAAFALCEAFRAIQSENMKENREAAASVADAAVHGRARR